MNGRRTVERTTNGERGAATVWAVGAIAILGLLAALLLSMTAAVAARHRVTAAADLAALAAAARAPDGARQACAAARWVAVNMDAELLECRLSGWVARTEVRARTSGAFGWSTVIRAHARAGPAPST